MYQILYEKIKMDQSEDNLHSTLTSDKAESLESDLVQVQTVTDLLFMSEISHIMTISSKRFQEFDVLPYHFLHAYNRVKNNLLAAKNSLKQGQFPEVFHVD